MKILILEGIATSGKSTITESIKGHLSGMDIRVASEAETHIPIMQRTSELHLTFFKDLIKRLVTEKPDLIVFDRLYLTQAFRAGVDLSGYSALEKLLLKFDALTVFLKVEEHAIAKRVLEAAKLREPSWGEYLKTKGTTNKEIADYYISQQKNQFKLLSTSKLLYIVCDTTDHNYDEVIQQILEKLELK